MICRPTINMVLSLPGRSCVTQLLSVLDDWTRAMMEGHNTDVVYFDFSKAFDTVPHKCLKHKLRAYGIGGEAFGVATEFSFRSRTECCRQSQFCIFFLETCY